MDKQEERYALTVKLYCTRVIPCNGENPSIAFIEGLSNLKYLSMDSAYWEIYEATVTDKTNNEQHSFISKPIKDY